MTVPRAHGSPSMAVTESLTAIVRHETVSAGPLVIGRRLGVASVVALAVEIGIVSRSVVEIGIGSRLLVGIGIGSRLLVGIGIVSRLVIGLRVTVASVVALVGTGTASRLVIGLRVTVASVVALVGIGIGSRLVIGRRVKVASVVALAVATTANRSATGTTGRLELPTEAIRGPASLAATARRTVRSANRTPGICAAPTALTVSVRRRSTRTSRARNSTAPPSTRSKRSRKIVPHGWHATW